MRGAECPGGGIDALELRDLTDHFTHASDPELQEPRPRIVLLTPYTGDNLGDAAIQDAMIANLRLRLPGAQFSGISLNCDNFVERHGVGAFPLHGTDRPFYGMSGREVVDQSGDEESFKRGPSQEGLNSVLLRRALKTVPPLWWCLKTIHAWGGRLGRELRHFVDGYRFLRAQDLLIVSGGGQLDEEWGGPWRHPFALLKWAVLARLARVPYVVASVGARKETSRTSRFFLFAALCLAKYRSYRDENSKQIAASLLHLAAGDSVVPDLAFSLPASELPPPAGIRSIAQDRRVVAISPIAYAKPLIWSFQDRALYERYLRQMAKVVSQLLERGYFLVIVWSCLWDAQNVIPELFERLDDESKKSIARQMHVPAIATWKDLVALLLDVDLLIASRLHSTILGFRVQKPTIAISFDPKVDWVMDDLGQTDYLLQIRDFTAESVIKALYRIELRRESVTKQIASYQDRIASLSARQYDTLAEIARTSRRGRD